MPSYGTVVCTFCNYEVPTIDQQRLQHEVRRKEVSWTCPGSQVVQ